MQKLCLAMMLATLPGCAGPLWEPWYVPGQEAVFGLESCGETVKTCEAGMNTTRIGEIVVYFDPAGFAYLWRGETVEKTRWLAKRWNDRECFFLEGFSGPCTVVSPREASRWSSVLQGDSFALRQRYESGNRAMPSAFHMSHENTIFTDRAAKIRQTLNTWDATIATGGPQ